MHDVPDYPQVMMARMVLCNKFQGNDKSPAVQYKEVLAQKKLATTQARRKENEYEQLSHSGFVLKIALKNFPLLENPQDEKDGLLVSGGITLNALQDRII